LLACAPFMLASEALQSLMAANQSLMMLPIAIKRRPRAAGISRFAAFLLLFSFVSLLPGLSTLSLRAAQDKTPASSATPGKPDYAWAPALLYAILQAPNAAARNALYDAAFAAGRPIVPQLEAAIQDDRTAEFAAQSLAFIGGDKALGALAKLINDPRDLDLSRFYYGALGEFDTPEANQILLNVIRNANRQPDRTVTEAAIIALTARFDVSLVAPLKQAESKLTDPVIQDDVENAISIIQSRGRYLVSQRGKSAQLSIPQAVRAYFLPATAPATASVLHTGSSSAPPSHASTPPAGAHVRIQGLAFAPGKTRALAHVVFEDSAAIANYRIVLQQQHGSWTVASVWLGSETERPAPAAH